MPGKFKFALTQPDTFNQAAYLKAIHQTRKLKPPADIYVAYGPEDMGVAMVGAKWVARSALLYVPCIP